MSAYRFIAAERANYPVALMCRVLGVSRSGFYAWRSRPPSRRELDDRALIEKIRQIHADSRRTYGAPRIWAELRFEGYRLSRKRVARLMRAARLQGLHQRRTWRSPRTPTRPSPPDRVRRRFVASAPNRIWVADITYVFTAQGSAFLAVVMDLHSRSIVGWELAPHLLADLPLAALESAITARRPARGLIHHSDHGARYASAVFAERLDRAGILPSMGALRSAYDNAVVESFFATLKRESAHRRRFHTRAEARYGIGEWIQFYNSRRRHSALGYRSPHEFERMTDLVPT